MTEIRGVKIPTKSGLTVAGLIALVAFAWSVDDRYLHKAFAGEVQETLKEIRLDIQSVRKEAQRAALQNELDRWIGRVVDLEIRYGIGCAQCQTGSAQLELYLNATQQLQKMQQQILSAGN